MAYLTEDELATYLQYVARYASCQYSAPDSTETLRLEARGARVADAAEQQAIAQWAADVFDRLMEEEIRADREAQARQALGTRLGISTDAIDTLSVESVTWPDACLGIESEGLMCAQVLTPGYRIRLEVAGTEYEYRSNRLGTSLVEVAQAAPTATALPTATPVPTSLPTATAQPTPQPTWTPAPTPTTTFVATDWLAQYYNNDALSGSPVLVRNDVDIAFDWGYGSPAWGVPNDHFAVRWSRKLWFEDGNYTFTLAADDGVRLWVAGNLLIDRWYGGEYSTTVTQHLWKGQYEVVVEYFELEGIARAKLSWEKQMPTPTPTLSPDEWIAEYYGNRTLSGQPVVVRNEEEIAFDWLDSSPDKGIPTDNFSARYTRTLTFEPGLYELHLVVDDGVRVYVDDECVLDAWKTGIRRELTATVALKGEQRLRVEYFERGGGAALFLGWTKVADSDGREVPSGASAPVPTQTLRMRLPTLK